MQGTNLVKCCIKPLGLNKIYRTFKFLEEYIINNNKTL